MTEMLRLDADVRNADWVKTRTWDLPTTLEELLVTIGGKSGIPRLLASPVAEAMPPAEWNMCKPVCEPIRSTRRSR